MFQMPVSDAQCKINELLNMSHL